jgi:glycosyltransferase involved in cell wall biosynthesis
VPIGSNVECAPPIGYDRFTFRAELGIQPDDLALAYFGTLNASKGVDVLLDAFDLVIGRQPRARLMLLGGEVGASDPTDRASARRAQARIRRFGSAILRTGWLPTRELSAYLLAADVALLPYLDGASARRGSLLACAAHGLPIVSTTPAGQEVAPYIEAVPPRAEMLADAAVAAGHDPARLRAASRALAQSVSWPSIATRHVAVYERLLYSRP